MDLGHFYTVLLKQSWVISLKKTQLCCELLIKNNRDDHSVNSYILLVIYFLKKYNWRCLSF